MVPFVISLIIFVLMSCFIFLIIHDFNYFFIFLPTVALFLGLYSAITTAGFGDGEVLAICSLFGLLAFVQMFRIPTTKRRGVL